MDRHLLPDELELLLDADFGLEAGFGVAPLRAHVRECAGCREALTEEEAVADALGTLPHFAPRAGFADRVMADVHVFEPWYVALGDTARSLVPASTPLRVAAAGGALAAGALLTAVTLWVLARADVLAFTTDAAAARGREALWGGLQDLAAALAGSTGAATSAGTVALALAMFVAALLVAGTGLRAAAAASRRSAAAGGDEA